MGYCTPLLNFEGLRQKVGSHCKAEAVSLCLRQQVLGQLTAQKQEVKLSLC